MVKGNESMSSHFVQSETLRPGYAISRVINGGWQLAGGHGAVDRHRATVDFEKFLFAGINTFDCADIYTGVESMLGDFVENVRNRYGAEMSESIKIHTKLVPDLQMLKSCDGSYIEEIIDRSLQRLKIDQLHLVQFFWWDLSIGSPIEIMMSLKRLQEKGKICHLGVTNWDAAQIAPFVEAGMDIVSAQVQYSLLDHRPKASLVAWCQKHDAKLLCYGTLAGGFLGESWVGVKNPGFDFENRSLVKYRLIIDEFGGWDLFQTLLETLKDCSEKHGVSVSGVATRYVLEQPQVGAVIVGSRNADRLRSTLSVFQFELDADDHSAITAILREGKGPSGSVYELESDRSGRHGSIMKYDLNAA